MTSLRDQPEKTTSANNQVAPAGDGLARSPLGTVNERHVPLVLQRHLALPNARIRHSSR